MHANEIHVILNRAVRALDFNGIIYYLLFFMTGIKSVPGKPSLLRRYHWFSRKMTSEKRAQKFHTDNASLARSGKCFWLVENLLPPIRGTTQIWVVTRHQYGISALVSQTSFSGETSGGVAKCRLFSQATFASPRELARRVLTLWHSLSSRTSRVGHRYNFSDGHLSN